jgi:hypothetical protein
MPIGPDLLIDLYRGLVHRDPRQRDQHANSVTDIHRSMSDAEVHGIGTLLAALAVWEPDPDAREAQLHALDLLHQWDQTAPDAIELVSRIDRTTLAVPEIEYVAYLLGSDAD